MQRAPQHGHIRILQTSQLPCHLVDALHQGIALRADLPLIQQLLQFLRIQLGDVLSGHCLAEPEVRLVRIHAALLHGGSPVPHKAHHAAGTGPGNGSLNLLCVFRILVRIAAQIPEPDHRVLPRDVVDQLQLLILGAGGILPGKHGLAVAGCQIPQKCLRLRRSVLVHRLGCRILVGDLVQICVVGQRKAVQIQSAVNLLNGKPCLACLDEHPVKGHMQELSLAGNGKFANILAVDQQRVPHFLVRRSAQGNVIMLGGRHFDLHDHLVVRIPVKARHIAVSAVALPFVGHLQITIQSALLRLGGQLRILLLDGRDVQLVHFFRSTGHLRGRHCRIAVGDPPVVVAADPYQGQPQDRRNAGADPGPSLFLCICEHALTPYFSFSRGVSP
ncbi:unknown [Ruminococcus sp. CAG:379]|nr:unknown [Ruminococcus sp. CAG:379]